MKVELGDKVYIPGYKRPFRVKARDNRYIICTKPYNPRHTVIYFIIDLQDKWRAPDDRVFCSGYETDDDCKERLEELQSGEISLSRQRTDIDVTGHWKHKIFHDDLIHYAHIINYENIPYDVYIQEVRIEE